MKNTKIIVGVLIVLTLIFTFLSVNDYVIDLPERSPEPKKTAEIAMTYKYENDMYSVVYPEGWTLSAREDSGLLIENKHTALYIDVNKSVYPESSDEEKLNEKENNLRRIVNDAGFEETTDAYINGRLYRIIEYTTTKDGKITYNKVYFTIDGQYEYEIYFYCNEADYNEYLNELDDMVLSFEIK